MLLRNKVPNNRSARTSYLVPGTFHLSIINICENIVIKLSKVQRRQDGYFCIWNYWGNGTYAYSYVGNTYTVNYNDQNSSEIYLEYRIESVNGQWTAKEISITVNAKLKDGSTAEKELLIQPTYNDSMREIRISVK